MRGKIIAALLGVFFLGGGIVLLIEATPEQQAKREVARCAEIARIMMTPDAFEQNVSRARKRTKTLFGDGDFVVDAPLARGYLDALYGHTLTCLYGRR